MASADPTPGSPENRVALVTGASSGIGRAIALALVAAGARVIAVARDGDGLERVVAAAADAGPRIDPVTCDITDDAALDRLAERVASTAGGLDVLVHSAGAIEFGTVADAPVDRLDRMVRVNLRAPYGLTRAVLPLLVRNEGDIVFVNSSAGIRPSAGVAAYGAAKHGLRGLADALRDEVNPLGVRVTSLYPGRTRTPLQGSVYQWEGRDEPLDGLLEPADIAVLVMAILALPRTAEVTDLHVRPARPPAMPARPRDPDTGEGGAAPG